MLDYKAVLSGQSWNSLPSLKTSKKPVFLTYTFNPSSFFSLSGWSKFKNDDKAMARKALKMWGDASGIRFIEVKGNEAELKFQWQKEWGDYSGRAEFPELTRDTSDEGLVRSYMGGNIYMNARYRSELSQHQPFKLYILLHEIGHALGLKHPFHKMPYNKQLMRSDLDHVKHSVMSYTGGDLKMQPIGLGSLDIQAIRALYGSPSQDGKHVAKWSWSNAKQTLTQVGKSKADAIHGVEVKDIIKGGRGDDKIYGFNGNDILYGEDGDDFLSGSDGDDMLYGGIGNDVLRGGYESDTLYGGAGDDALNGGDDDDILYGDAGNDVVKGEDDDDTLYGDAGNDVMNGGDGNDLLLGGDGNDYLEGGDSDSIFDSSFDNNDTLNGGAGNDILKGGKGSDHFVFDTWLNGVDVDQIVDFESFEDKIILSSTVFSALAVGILSYDAFVEGPAARDANDRIIFNDVAMSLSYDPDGVGPVTAMPFTTFSDWVSIYYDDILVV